MTMTLITGNTYPVKDALKALGGKWDADRKGWMVPDAKAADARKLVAGGGDDMAARRARIRQNITRANAGSNLGGYPSRFYMDLDR
jgi:hypothetical protein